MEVSVLGFSSNNGGLLLLSRLECFYLQYKAKGALWPSEPMKQCTGWSVFETSAGSLDEHTNTGTSYISFCDDMCLSTENVPLVQQQQATVHDQTQTTQEGYGECLSKKV